MKGEAFFRRGEAFTPPTGTGLHSDVNASPAPATRGGEPPRSTHEGGFVI
jgi:hypothetical protein